jgi:hypothetical protein
MLPRVSILLFIFAFVVPLCGAAFLGTATQSKTSITTTTTIQSRLGMSDHPFCDLPGDPSLILTTNVDLGDKKLQIMKSISKAIEQHTGKPESYIGT